MIDYILVAFLIGVLPAWALYKSFRDRRTTTNRPKRYLKSGATIAGLLVLLCYDWWHHARSPTSLGLDIPLSPHGLIGLVIAAVLFVILVAFGIIKKRKEGRSDGQRPRGKISDNDLLPRNRHELLLWIGVALLVGCGWELLYRGFLIWFFASHIGTVGAVCIAALAYGAAHGYKNRGQFVASVISAFAFTIAFVLTGSLWWLMIIHTTLAVFGGFLSYKVASDGGEGLPHRSAGVSSQ